MSFQICIKTDKSLQQLSSEIRVLLSLPPYQHTSQAGESYYQFEMFGMLILLHKTDVEDRNPEVIDYPYAFDLQCSFVDHELDTDEMEYQLQPYYAQLLTFHLGLDTAYHEQQKVGPHWQIRYHCCHKNLNWNPSILYGEPGWQPAVLQDAPTRWRTMHPAL
jgi:hypothetical protein